MYHHSNAKVEAFLATQQSGRQSFYGGGGKILYQQDSINSDTTTGVSESGSDYGDDYVEGKRRNDYGRKSPSGYSTALLAPNATERGRSRSTCGVPLLKSPVVTRTISNSNSDRRASNIDSLTVYPSSYPAVVYSSYEEQDESSDFDSDRSFRRPSPSRYGSNKRRLLPPTPSVPKIVTRVPSAPHCKEDQNDLRSPLTPRRSLAESASIGSPKRRLPVPKPVDKQSEEEEISPLPQMRSHRQKDFHSRHPDFSKTIRQSSIDKRDWNEPPQSQTPSPPMWKQSGDPGYQPELHSNGICSPKSRKYCQRRPSLQDANHYVETPCTCKEQHDSHGHSQQQANLEGNSSFDYPGSKSSSDVDDCLSNSTSGTPSKDPTVNCRKSGLFPQNSTASNSFPEITSGLTAVVDPGGKVRSLSQGSSSCPENVNLANNVNKFILGGLGMVKLIAQYFPIRRRLRIAIDKAEGLAGSGHKSAVDIQLNAYLKVSLMPGKLQKQQSRVVKTHQTATFNEEFFFDNITVKEIDSKCVALKLLHHLGKQFQKDPVLGVIEIPLNSINGLLTKKEIHLQEELRPRLNAKKLGKLQISLCIEKEAKRLTVDVVKAVELPKFGICGPPDPCVRITVDQNGKLQTKQTRTLKGTCRAVYNEAVMFLISTKATDMEHTSVQISVVDTSRSASGSDALGYVYLGSDSKEKSELDQWTNSLTFFGKQFKATHTLRTELL